MKRTLLSLGLIFIGLAQANAQCTPNPSYITGNFGVYPDTITDFIPGAEGVFYSDTIHLLIPISAQDIDPTLPAATIDSVQLVSVAGIPPGLAIDCNSQTSGPCTMLPTQIGCALMEGTPTQQGIYPLTIEVLGYAFGGLISVPYSFTGYQIDIGGVGIAEVNDVTFSGVRNVPNPFSAGTEIRFDLKKAADVELQVYDLLGQSVYNTSLNAVKGTNAIKFEGDTYEQGIYIYQLSANGTMHTGRMVLDR